MKGWLKRRGGAMISAVAAHIHEEIAVVQKEALTALEAAAALQVSLDTVLHEIRRGNLVARKVGRAYRISPRVLERYIDMEGEPTRGAKK